MGASTVPYSTIYSPGGVYAHPAVPPVTNPVNMDLPPNSSDAKDHGLTKKLKRSDGYCAEANGEGSVDEATHSLEHDTDASSKGVDGDTRDERQLKRERRKQANRESARRSRLRKQAETEELLKRYETLKMENIDLKSEINQLMGASEKLRVDNAALMGKLNGTEVARPEP